MRDLEELTKTEEALQQAERISELSSQPGWEDLLSILENHMQELRLNDGIETIEDLKGMQHAYRILMEFKRELLGIIEMKNDALKLSERMNKVRNNSLFKTTDA